MDLIDLILLRHIINFLHAAVPDWYLVDDTQYLRSSSLFISSKEHDIMMIMMTWEPTNHLQLFFIDDKHVISQIIFVWYKFQTPLCGGKRYLIVITWGFKDNRLRVSMMDSKCKMMIIVFLWLTSILIINLLQMQNDDNWPNKIMKLISQRIRMLNFKYFEHF